MKISELEKGRSENTSVTLPGALMSFVRSWCKSDDESFSKKVKRWALADIEKMPIRELAKIAEDANDQ